MMVIVAAAAPAGKHLTAIHGVGGFHWLGLREEWEGVETGLSLGWVGVSIFPKQSILQPVLILALPWARPQA